MSASNAVEQIRTFAEGVDDPEKWTVVVPEALFDDVKGQLDTHRTPVTKYQGISLCYGTHGETDVYVTYRSELSDHE